MLATVNMKDMLTDEKLKAAFNMFDIDGSGEITIDEIIKVLGGGHDPEAVQEWKDIINNIDTDGNGEISFKEFKKMMI